MVHKRDKNSSSFYLKKWKIERVIHKEWRKQIGWGITIACLFLGLTGVGLFEYYIRRVESFVEKRMTDRGEQIISGFEKEFERLKSVPSYAFNERVVTINDSTDNFIALPTYPDTKEQANYDECHWWINRIDHPIAAVTLELDAEKDSSDGIRKYKIYADVRKIMKPALVGSPELWPPRRDIPLKAQAFVFAIRSGTNTSK